MFVSYSKLVLKNHPQNATLKRALVCEQGGVICTLPLQSTSLQELEDMARGRRREEAEENQRKSLKRVGAAA